MKQLLIFLLLSILIITCYGQREALKPIRRLARYGSAIFRKPDPAVGKLFKSYDPETDPRNPEELGNLVEGDMKLPRPKPRNGLVGNAYAAYRWPNATIFYQWNANFSKEYFIKLKGN